MSYVNRSRCVSAAASLVLLACGAGVQAAPVTGWVTILGEADFAGDSETTGSPVMTRADGDVIAAGFDAITLAEVGQSITLTGSVTIDAAVVNGKQFRWGLFDGPAPLSTNGSGYVGVWAGIGATNDNVLARGDGTETNPFASGATTAFGSESPEVGTPKGGSPIQFSLTIDRISATEIAVSGLATAISAETDFPIAYQWNAETTASPASFTYDRVSFLFGGAIGGTEAAFSNVDVSFVPEPASLALAGAGSALMLLRRRRR